MTMFRSLRASNKQRGIAMVEFAIVLPILLILTWRAPGSAARSYSTTLTKSVRRRRYVRRALNMVDRRRPDNATVTA
jgi:hypothetical protein